MKVMLKNGGSFETIQDKTPENPRGWDNAAVMVCFHGRYNLGDQHEYRLDDYSGWGALREQIEQDHDVAVILPLYLCDHSGITMRTTSDQFRACDGAGWDWGQVVRIGCNAYIPIGWIYITMEKAIENWGDWRTYVDGEALERPLERSDWLKKVRAGLVAEVETYDQYLTGNIWGFVVHGPPCESCGGEGEVTDSCWGFYGDDPYENGMFDHIDADSVAEIREAMGKEPKEDAETR
jgi:hypothetical protein